MCVAGLGWRISTNQFDILVSVIQATVDIIQDFLGLPQLISGNGILNYVSGQIKYRNAQNRHRNSGCQNYRCRQFGGKFHPGVKFALRKELVENVRR